MDFESTYRKYKVQRKMPIGKHERILAIDGDYIHVSALRFACCVMGLTLMGRHRLCLQTQGPSLTA